MTVSSLYQFYEKYMATTPVSPVSKQKLARYITNRFEADTVTERRGQNNDDVERVWDGVFIPFHKREEIQELHSESL
jgi:hypothetical protein